MTLVKGSVSSSVRLAHTLDRIFSFPPSNLYERGEGKKRVFLKTLTAVATVAGNKTTVVEKKEGR